MASLDLTVNQVMWDPQASTVSLANLENKESMDCPDSLACQEKMDFQEGKVLMELLVFREYRVSQDFLEREDFRESPDSLLILVCLVIRAVPVQRDLQDYLDLMECLD